MGRSRILQLLFRPRGKVAAATIGCPTRRQKRERARRLAVASFSTCWRGRLDEPVFVVADKTRWRDNQEIINACVAVKDKEVSSL